MCKPEVSVRLSSKQNDSKNEHANMVGADVITQWVKALTTKANCLNLIQPGTWAVEGER